MRKELMDHVTYCNKCRKCNLGFTSKGWMKAYCKSCLKQARVENKQAAKKKRLLSYRRHTRLIQPNIGYGHCGKYKGLFCQSTWELAVAIWAFSEGHHIERSPKVIRYKFEGTRHKYHPDFEINGTTYEIKGRVTPQELAKQVAAKEQGIEIVFVDPTACEFYFEYVYSKFGMDPRTEWEKFYDKKLLQEGTREAAQANVDFKRYSLAQIMQEKSANIKKEKLLNNYPLLRSERSARIFYLLAANGPSPVKEYVTQLQEAFKFLYPNA